MLPGPGLEGHAMRKSLLCAALLLTLAACGGEDKKDEALSADEQTAADNISAYWQESNLAKEPADCLGEKTVRSFGLAHLKDLGVLDDELRTKSSVDTWFTSEADSVKAATNNVDCISLPELLKQSYPGIDDDTAECLADAFGRDRYIEAMAQTMQGASFSTPPEVEAEMEKCVPQS